MTFVELEIQRGGGVRNPYVIEYCFNQLDIELKYLCMHTNINPILNAICYAWKETIETANHGCTQWVPALIKKRTLPLVCGHQQKIQERHLSWIFCWCPHTIGRIIIFINEETLLIQVFVYDMCWNLYWVTSIYMNVDSLYLIYENMKAYTHIWIYINTVCIYVYILWLLYTCTCFLHVLRFVEPKQQRCALNFGEDMSNL